MNFCHFHTKSLVLVCFLKFVNELILTLPCALPLNFEVLRLSFQCAQLVFLISVVCLCLWLTTHYPQTFCCLKVQSFQFSAKKFQFLDLKFVAGIQVFLTFFQIPSLLSVLLTCECFHAVL